MKNTPIRKHYPAPGEAPLNRARTLCGRIVEYWRIVEDDEKPTCWECRHAAFVDRMKQQEAVAA